MIWPANPKCWNPELVEICNKGYASACPKLMEQNYSVLAAAIGVPVQSDANTFGTISAIYLPQFATLEQIENGLLPPPPSLSQNMGQALLLICD